MGFTLPFIKQKRYLSGMDWIICAMDYTLRRITTAGNIFQIALMLDSPPEEDALRQKLSGFLKEFPILGGRIARSLNLVPYWKFTEKGPVVIDFNVHNMDGAFDKDRAFRLMEECVNKPFRGRNEHIAFHLIKAGNGESCLLATFDHKLFDARGAERFMNMFFQYLNGGDVSSSVRTTAPSGLSRWIERFSAGQAVNRRFIALSKTPSRVLPVGGKGTRMPVRFKLISFDKQKTSAIFERAYEEAGFLMEMPYLLASVVQAMHSLFKSRDVPGQGYIIPVTVDTRSPADIKEEIFFNFASFFFFQVLADSADDRKAVIREIKNQMYEQVQNHLPGKIADASTLIRIAPLSVLSRIMDAAYGGKLFSFAFSYFGKSSFESPGFMGAGIRNVFHMPCVPMPPGMGIFFNVYGGCLNATVSWIESMISDDEAEKLEKELRDKL